MLFLTSTVDFDVLLRMLEAVNSETRLSEDGEWAAELVAESEAAEKAEVDLAEEIDEEAETIGIPEAELDREPVAAEPQMRATPEGAQGAFLALALERWLASSPEGPYEIGEQEASEALLALVFGWSSTVVHALAAKPLTVAELEQRIPGMEAEAIAERVRWLAGTGLAEARRSADGETRYAATDWLREAIAPLAIAARMEHRYPRAGRAPIDSLDIETAFLLTLPLVELPAHLSERLNGSCSLGVELESAGATGVVGVTIRVEAGRLLSGAAGLDENVDALATGSVEDWLDTIIEPDAKRVRTSGDRLLAGVLLNSLHRALFGVPNSPPRR